MANKRLGIMVTKYQNIDHIAGIVRAARKAGHAVQLFLTDEGVRFTRDPKFLDLLKTGGVECLVCEHNCELIGIHDTTEGITYGSQYNNAGMLHGSERVLVF